MILIYRCFDLYRAVPVDGIRSDVVAIEYAVEGVETPVNGAMTGFITEVPLAHHPSPVPPAAQNLGQEYLVLRNACHAVGVATQAVHEQVHGMAGRVQGIGDVRADRIPARQEPCPGGGAERGSGAEASQANASGSHAIQVWRVDWLRIKIAIAQIVDQDDNDVWQCFPVVAGLDAIQIGRRPGRLEVPAKMIVEAPEANAAGDQGPAQDGATSEECATAEPPPWLIAHDMFLSFST